MRVRGVRVCMTFRMKLLLFLCFFLSLRSTRGDEASSRALLSILHFLFSFLLKKRRKIEKKNSSHAPVPAAPRGRAARKCFCVSNGRALSSAGIAREGERSEKRACAREREGEIGQESFGLKKNQRRDRAVWCLRLSLRAASLPGAPRFFPPPRIVATGEGFQLDAERNAVAAAHSRESTHHFSSSLARTA